MEYQTVAGVRRRVVIFKDSKNKVYYGSGAFNHRVPYSCNHGLFNREALIEIHNILTNDSDALRPTLNETHLIGV